MKLLLKGSILAGALLSSVYSQGFRIPGSIVRSAFSIAVATSISLYTDTLFVEGLNAVPASNSFNTNNVFNLLQENCDLGGSCNSTSCVGAGVTGLCSSTVQNDYAISWNSTITTSSNPLILSHMNFPIEGTSSVYHLINGNGEVFAKVFIGTIGAGIAFNKLQVVSAPLTGETVQGNYYRLPSTTPLELQPGTPYTVYLRFVANAVQLLMEWGGPNPSNQLVEMATINITQKSTTISSIILASGPQSVSSVFSQLWNFAPRFQSFAQQDQTTSYSAGLSKSINSMFAYSYNNATQYLYKPIPWNEGFSLYIAQGFQANDFLFTFQSFGKPVVTLKMALTSTEELNATFKNLVTGESNELQIPSQFGSQKYKSWVGLSNIRFLISGGKLLLGFEEQYIMGINVRGLSITDLSTPIWYTLTSTASYPTPLSYNGNVDGAVPCQVGVESCTGTEYIFEKSMEQGQSISFTATFAPAGINNLPTRVPNAQNIIGAITASDGHRVRLISIIQETSLSIILFDSAGIVVNSCSGILPIYQQISKSRTSIQVTLGIDSQNNMGINLGPFSKSSMILCKVQLGDIELSNFKVNTGFLEGSEISFEVSNSYEDVITNTVSDSTLDSVTCYLGSNGKCSSRYIVEYTNSGIGQGTYSHITSKNVILPFSLQAISTETGNKLLTVDISQNAVITMTNLVANQSDTTILPMLCYSQLLTNGFEAVLTSDSSSLYLVMCHIKLLVVPVTGLNIPMSILFPENSEEPFKHNVIFPAFQLASIEANLTKPEAIPAPLAVNGSIYSYGESCAIKNFGTNCTGSMASISQLGKAKNGFGIIISGIAANVIDNKEYALSVGTNPNEVLQIFNIFFSGFESSSNITLAERNSLQLVLSTNSISIYDYRGGSGFGGNLPNNIVLSNGDNFRIKIGYLSDNIYLLFEYPFNSGTFYSIVTAISWGSSWRNFIAQSTFTQGNLIGIDSTLNTGQQYTFEIINNYSGFSKTGSIPSVGINECQLVLLGVCGSSTTMLPVGGALQNQVIELLEGIIYNYEYSYVLYDDTNSAIVTINVKSNKTYWTQNSVLTLTNYLGDSVTVSNGGSPISVVTVLTISSNTLFYKSTSSEAAISLRNKRFSKIVVESGAWYTTRLTKATSFSLLNSTPSYTGAVANKYASFDIPHVIDYVDQIDSFTSELYNLSTNSPTINRVEFTITLPNNLNPVLDKAFNSIPGFLQSFIFTLDDFEHVYSIFIGRGFVSITSNSVGEAMPETSCGGPHLINQELNFGDNYGIGMQKVGDEIEFYGYLNLNNADLLTAVKICSIPATSPFNIVRFVDQTNVDTFRNKIAWLNTISIVNSADTNVLVPYSTLKDVSTAPIANFTTVLNFNSFLLTTNITDDVIFNLISGEDATYSIVVMDGGVLFRSTLTEEYTIASISSECFANGISIAIGILAENIVLTGCGSEIGSLPILGNIFDEISISEGVLNVSWRPDVRFLKSNGRIYQSQTQSRAAPTPAFTPKPSTTNLVQPKVQQFMIISSLHTIP